MPPGAGQAVGSVPPDSSVSQMPTTTPVGGPGGRAPALQVRLRLRVHPHGGWVGQATHPPRGVSGALGPRQAPPTRSLCADMEVLYWQHVREQLETLQKLKRREVSALGLVGRGLGAVPLTDAVLGQMAKQWLPEAEDEEEVWPAEEERLEGSLEDLGAAGGCSQVCVCVRGCCVCIRAQSLLPAPSR